MLIILMKSCIYKEFALNTFNLLTFTQELKESQKMYYLPELWARMRTKVFQKTEKRPSNHREPASGCRRGCQSCTCDTRRTTGKRYTPYGRGF